MYINNYISLYKGDSRNLLEYIEPETVQTVVTSPPYWGLRDYGTDKQIGLEKTPEEYINNLVMLFRDIRTALHDTGTVWLNLGDSYSSGGRTSTTNDSLRGNKLVNTTRTPVTDNLKPKDLVGIPWKVAFALQADDWYLRSDIIWSKPNPMPESVTDRPTKAHEYIFLLSKSQNYYYDSDAIKEKSTQLEYRNKRSVWEVNTRPYPDAHFATYPEKLIEPCILAGTSEKGCCPVCKSPWVKRTNLDWYPSCEHNVQPMASTILDPFVGSGTTCAVAQRLGRKGIGIDMSEEYIKLATKRISRISMPMF